MQLGVESYLLRDDLVLYEASSPKEFAESVELPDHGVGVVAVTESRAFYMQKIYDRKPTKEDVEASYKTIGSELARELSSRGVYTKEVLLIPSNSEVSIPKDVLEEFGEEKKSFKACSLLWLWLVSPEHVQT